MKKIISISEVVETVEAGSQVLELCATADAAYDEAKAQLLMELDSHLRPAGGTRTNDGARLPWQPKKSVVTEAVPLEEALPVAREIFSHWVKKLRKAIPKPQPQPII